MMSYVVTWLDHETVIAEKEFDDLIKAGDYVFKSTRSFKLRGATSARVWDDRATYFQIEWPDGDSPKRAGLMH